MLFFTSLLKKLQSALTVPSISKGRVTALVPDLSIHRQNSSSKQKEKKLFVKDFSVTFILSLYNNPFFFHNSPFHRNSKQNMLI